MKKLYRFRWDVRRGGRVEGLFVAEEECVKAAIGKELYFGEILGKHSDLFGTLEEGDVKVLTDDQDFIAKFKQLGCETGYSPLDYIREDEDEESEEE